MQHFLHKQVTQPMQCTGRESGCSVAFTESDSFTIGFNVNLQDPGDYGWISGGFSVSKTWTEGKTYTCSGEGDTVAVWEPLAFTSYRVKETGTGNCVGDFREYTIYSPNTNNRGSPGFYCVYGEAVRNLGDAYWEHDIREGGP